jgi:hypothetical protein
MGAWLKAGERVSRRAGERASGRAIFRLTDRSIACDVCQMRAGGGRVFVNCGGKHIGRPIAQRQLPSTRPATHEMFRLVRSASATAPEVPRRELLKTYCAGESVSSGARRTLGTCLLLTANFTRSRRFLEAPRRVNSPIGGRFRT